MNEETEIEPTLKEKTAAVQQAIRNQIDMNRQIAKDMDENESLLDDEKVYVFKSLLDASRYSGLPFTTRRDLAEKWLAEIDLQMERNDEARRVAQAQCLR